ncbi:MAG: outer membrane beta-barrel domain-containing protein [Gammaproteobacteria bacterium]|nr:outer membrane beta-barrel domain-containing protein [Gammaproteobacteria bacterium]
MDRGLHVLLLTALAATALPGLAQAQAAGDTSALPTQQPQVVEPAVKRRDVEPAAIDTENFEAGLFVGTISIEDFGSSVVYGARGAYHFTEDLFAEATIGTAKAGKTSYEDLSGAAELLTDSERQYTYYDLAIGWNALPGEVFFGGKRAMPSAVYFTLGAGSTTFAGDDHFTVSVGSGFRLLVNDWVALHLDVRDHMFNSDLLGKDKLTQNLQVGLSLTAFF